MILVKVGCRYDGGRRMTVAVAVIRSTSKPTNLPSGSLNSLGVYGMFTPTTSLPVDLMFSGTVFAMVSTFSTVAADVGVVGAALSVLLVHPENARAPHAANTAPMRQVFPRRS